jgi:hypothetical protein
MSDTRWYVKVKTFNDRVIPHVYYAGVSGDNYKFCSCREDAFSWDSKELAVDALKNIRRWTGVLSTSLVWVGK